ncbi:MAG: nitroreductase/quinone reductase family protein [Candidatus Methylomirabilales bacterium]
MSTGVRGGAVHFRSVRCIRQFRPFLVGRPRLRGALSAISGIGRIDRRPRRSPVLLLTTIGRKSGRSCTTLLLYLEDGANWVAVASNARDDRHPAWWLSLTNPVATIQVKRRTHNPRRAMVFF